MIDTERFFNVNIFIDNSFYSFFMKYEAILTFIKKHIATHPKYKGYGCLSNEKQKVFFTSISLEQQLFDILDEIQLSPFIIYL